jgi:hypothetical protein
MRPLAGRSAQMFALSAEEVVRLLSGMRSVQ